MFVFRHFTFLLMLIAFITSGVACSLKSPPEDNSGAPFNNPGSNRTDILLFSGSSIWKLEAASIRQILYAHGATYRTVGDDELNAMEQADFKKYKALVIPGGDAEVVTSKLYNETRRKIRLAVNDDGLNYLGFCAGAWLAIAPNPPEGWAHSYGIGFVDAPLQEHTVYYRRDQQEVLLTAHYPDGQTRKQLWFGGPVTPNVPGGVIARYPDGKPAITQFIIDNSLIILSALHPTADKAMLSAINLYQIEAITPDVAWELLDSVINKKLLPAFDSENGTIKPVVPKNIKLSNSSNFNFNAIFNNPSQDFNR